MYALKGKAVVVVSL